MSDDPTGIAALALRHRKAIVAMLVVLCAAGAAAIVRLPSGIYPDLAFPRIVILAEHGEDAVDNVLAGITRPLERAASAVPGLVRIRSKTLRGAAELSLDFAPATDMREALSQARARVATALSELPAGTSTLVEQQTPSVFPVISFDVTLDRRASAGGPVRDAADLAQWVSEELAPRLARLPDVFSVSVQAADARVIAVTVDPLRLAESHLSVDGVIDAIQDANQVEAVGLVDQDHLGYQVLASAQARSLDELRRLSIAAGADGAIRLEDVADVELATADRTQIVTGNGGEAVVVSVFMRYGGRIVELSRNVTRTLADLAPSVPAGVHIAPVYDQADLVRDSLAGVRDAIVTGMVLAVLILWAFLGSWRLTAVAAVTIPVSVLISLAVLWAVGGTLNLMSLGGIAVAIGLIIDDSIVVVENVARSLARAPGSAAAVVRATGEVIGAVSGSSLTTVVVFLPLGLLEGVAGQFFTAMAVALTAGILVSMVVSLTLTPILAGSRFASGAAIAERRWMTRLEDRYERLVGAWLRSPVPVATALVLVALVGAACLRSQRTGFLPEIDEGGFVLDYQMPVGTSLTETDHVCRRIEAILASDPGVGPYSRRTGAELGFFVTEPWSGDFLVSLVPRDRRDEPSAAVVDRLRRRIAAEVPQVEVEFVQIMQDTINDLAGASAPIELQVFGSDYGPIRDAAECIAAQIETVPGVVDVVSGVSFGSPEITYRLDTAAVLRAGLTVRSVTRQLRAALLGETATTLRRDQLLVPVVVRDPDALRRDASRLESVPIADGAGRVIPAAALATLETRATVNELARENQQPVVTVEAAIEGRDLGSVARDLRQQLAALSLPDGVRVELGGHVAEQGRTFRQLTLVLVVAVGLVFVLLVAQFSSYRLPLLIFLTLPFSQIGALAALAVTGSDLNVSAFMGLVMLVGLVVKNGIILVEHTAQLRAAGAPTLVDALTRAGRVRLRPVLMTSLTAIIALLPLALNLGAGAELQRPLAIAVIGGLAISTVFTLIVIPVAHVLLGEPKRALATERGLER